jgi:uncharacterized membrane protein
MNDLVRSVLNTPQSAAMLIAGGIGVLLHYGCSVHNKRRRDPGRLVMFGASAAGMVAGVYVFFEALRSAYSTTAPSGLQQNAVWAGIGGACVAVFTFDLLLNELRSFSGKTDQAVEPILTQPNGEPGTPSTTSPPESIK